MRYVLLVMTVGTSLYGQAIMDATAAAAGGIAGGAAGKKVNDGLNKVLGNVATQTAKAAGDAKTKPVAVVQAPPTVAAAPAAPLLEVGPGVPKSGGVPLPPVPHGVAVQKPAPAPVPPPVLIAEPPPPPPPPPEATAEDLKNVAAGTNRDDLLKLGAPASRITMFDDGHLQETFRYYAHGPNGDTPIGVVRLVDGSVSSVVLR
jgi:hypothetical protein